MSRLVKKIRYGEKINLDFSNTDVKTATIYVERDTYSANGVKVVIEADISIPISGVKTS
jgi:hypothetical protein